MQARALHHRVEFIEELLLFGAFGGGLRAFRRRGVLGWLVGRGLAHLLQPRARGFEAGLERLEDIGAGRDERIDFGAQRLEQGIAEVRALQRLFDAIERGAHAVERLRRAGGRALRQRRGEGKAHQGDCAQQGQRLAQQSTHRASPMRINRGES